MTEVTCSTHTSLSMWQTLRMRHSPVTAPWTAPGRGREARPLSPAEIMGEGVATSQPRLQVAVVLLAPHLENSGMG